MHQLDEVVAALGLQRKAIEPCSRCIQCNRPTRPVTKAVVFGKVPDYVWETQATFHQCRQCRRIYWAGSHYKQIKATITRIFPEIPDGR